MLNDLSQVSISWGAFHSNLNFRKFQATNRGEFSEISEIDNKLAWYTEILLSYRNFQLNGFAFPELEKFADFLETFPGNFRTVCPRF